MADAIYIDTDLLLNVAKKLDNISDELLSLSSRLGSMHINRSAGGNVPIAGTTASILVRQYSQTGQNTADRIKKLGSNVRQVSSLFAETEKGLMFGITGSSSENESAGTANGVDDSAIRKTQANWIKIGVSALCVVGSITAIALTGGGAAVIIAAGAASGAITGFTNSAADQYADNGFNSINWGDAGKEAVIGSVVGAVTSAVSHYVGGGITNSAKNMVAKGVGSQILSHIESDAGRSVITNGVIGAFSQLASGGLSRAAGEVTYDLMAEGQINFEDAWNAATDMGAVAADTIIGGATGAYTGYQDVKGAKEYYSTLNPDLDSKYIDDNNQPRWGVMGLNGDNCAVNGQWDKTTLKPGTVIDRYGNPGGRFLAADGTPFDQRGLPYAQNDHAYHRYVVVNPNGITGETSVIQSIPGLNNGGGTQYRFDKTVSEMISLGEIREIFQNNTFSNSNYTMRHHGN